MSTSQDGAWKSKEQGEEASYAHAKEQAQLAEMRAKMSSEGAATGTAPGASQTARDDIEGGFGGQEDLEDRYATTSGEH